METATETRDHWWWRPGWRPGRRFYTWHFLLDGQPELHDIVQEIQSSLLATGVLDPVSIPWLHMTTQGVGFADEVAPDELAAIVDEVTEQVRNVGPIGITLGPLVVGIEGVFLPANPLKGLAEARAAVRGGIRNVWGHVPESDDFWPHVSLAYANKSGTPLASIEQNLRTYQKVIPVTLKEITLIELNRDDGYRWKMVRRLSL
ncbi:2'-5' RNA ligase [Sinosporangium album]|uniref:2'-5' RNA ligase n=1 Tax=Sinosporangium album TaxID=504805 RepID=A0A1G7VSD4_9ACTN|nr:2'-5' RNA ligase family protein [Sinosporangium album]SDG62617.1 2'-5' RNA ligase [Sinosporangium album]